MSDLLVLVARCRLRGVLLTVGDSCYRLSWMNAEPFLLVNRTRWLLPRSTTWMIPEISYSLL